jgi:D-sedoheptulose 7-phosphate isomerase
MKFIQNHLQESIEIIKSLDQASIEKIVDILADVKKYNGRIIFLGVGGSAANASHAVNDFRKIANIECYAPTDNVSELTARTNDEGWETVFSEWLRVSKLSSKDVVFILSVGGGDYHKKISPNLVLALDYAKSVGSRIVGIVGRDGGYTAQVADAYVLVPVLNEKSITPHTEGFQGLIWHLLVSHPRIKQTDTKWEQEAK